MAIDMLIAVCYSAVMTYPITLSDKEVASRLGVSMHVPRDWRIRNSIAPKYWDALDREGITTLRKLAAHASERSAEQKTEGAA
jgi:hypothetical protein